MASKILPLAILSLVSLASATGCPENEYLVCTDEEYATCPADLAKRHLARSIPLFGAGSLFPRTEECISECTGDNLQCSSSDPVLLGEPELGHDLLCGQVPTGKLVITYDECPTDLGLTIDEGESCLKVLFNVADIDSTQMHLGIYLNPVTEDRPGQLNFKTYCKVEYGNYCIVPISDIFEKLMPTDDICDLKLYIAAHTVQTNEETCWGGETQVNAVTRRLGRRAPPVRNPPGGGGGTPGQNWAYYTSVQFTCPPEECCCCPVDEPETNYCSQDTAYAVNDEECGPAEGSACEYTLVGAGCTSGSGGNVWGWWFKFPADSSFVDKSFPLYAGAAQNLYGTKGYQVGVVLITIQDGEASVKYEIEPEYAMGTAHWYISGDDVTTIEPNCRAPGKYTAQSCDLETSTLGLSTPTYTTDSDWFYMIFHADIIKAVAEGEVCRDKDGNEVAFYSCE